MCHDVTPLKLTTGIAHTTLCSSCLTIYRKVQGPSYPIRLNSEGHIKNIRVSVEAKQSTNTSLSTELKGVISYFNDIADGSTNVQNLRGKDFQPSESPATGAGDLSTAAGVDKQDNGFEQESTVFVFGEQFNAQLLEDHYQQFMHRRYGGRESQDGDDTSSRSSSSGQGSPCKQTPTSDSNSSTKNGKRCIGKISRGDEENSEDDEKTNKKRNPKRPRKTADEKQTELRCTEFAAGRQTTAKCLTYSTKYLHRLKSVRPPLFRRCGHSSCHNLCQDSI
jgi:hypothetical protein